MNRYNITLDTMKQMEEFVGICSTISGEIKVTDGPHVVDGKSLLGMAYALTFDKLVCISEKEIYNEIRKFCKD